MFSAPLLAAALSVAAPADSEVLHARRDDTPVGVMGVFNKAAKPLIWGAVATAVGVTGGVLSTVMVLGGMLLMGVSYVRSDNAVPGDGLGDFEGEFDNDALVNGAMFDTGKYSLIAAIFFGGFALIITSAGLALLVGGLVVRE